MSTSIDIRESAAGFRAAALRDALGAALEAEIDVSTDLLSLLPNGKRHPNDRQLGPLKPRGGPSGVVVAEGHVVATYGDVERADVTFSATKSYLSALAGIAVRDGLIADLDEPVAATVTDGGFESQHNAAITWRHLLQQTSEWEGELFGIPDWIDRGRQVSGTAVTRERSIGASAAASEPRRLEAPGTFWEYNDVRVNRLSLALLRRFCEPLPAVLKREIMDPLGASDTWTWHGYSTSWVEIAGHDVESVSGGAHWGGGLWISSLDHARFGQLYLDDGRIDGREVLPAGWVGATLEPCALNRGYGLLWWLNTDASISGVADAGAFAARGAGGNTVFVWPAANLVVVLRWCADTKTVLDGILRARA